MIDLKKLTDRELLHLITHEETHLIHVKMRGIGAESALYTGIMAQLWALKHELALRNAAIDEQVNELLRTSWKLPSITDTLNADDEPTIPINPADISRLMDILDKRKIGYRKAKVHPVNATELQGMPILVGKGKTAWIKNKKGKKGKRK